MADEADLAADLEQREREALLKGRQVDTWVQGHDPAVRAGLLGEGRLCAACGDPIPPARLEARPLARLCTECQAEMEGP
jgi:phage/conjugal plasmid C-4 type zinc finger TraR family protein